MPSIPYDPITATSTPEQDAANAAKYSTPLPPNDPASQSGARDNPLYIGPTNFGKLQQQYTPYQIEQATVRDASGNISWKQGVDINSIPVSPTKTTSFTTPAEKPLISTANANPTNINMTAGSASNSTAFAQAQSQAAQTNLNGLSKTIDDLYAKQQQLQADQKAAAEAKVAGLEGRLTDISNTTAYQDSLKRDRDLFQVTQNIQTLGDIRSKLADATSALEQGLIYEESQPVRMSLLVGRSAELKKQGVAQINALSSAAQVVQGNIDLARAYADDSIAAIKADNAEKINAVNTLLDLENAKVIQLTKDEKDTIANRMQLLQDENARVTKQKDDVFDLATKYPNAFVKGGVTFLDSRDEAVAKMVPQMAADEKTKFDLDVAQTKAQIAATGRSNAGGGSGSGTSSQIYSNMAADVAYLRGQINPDTNAPWTETDINLALVQKYGDQLKRTDLIAAIDQVLQGGPKPVAQRTPAQILEDNAAIEALKKKGLDAQGNPLPKTTPTGGTWWNPFSWGN